MLVRGVLVRGSAEDSFEERRISAAEAALAIADSRSTYSSFEYVEDVVEASRGL